MIIASKHQSAWETLVFNTIILDCAYVVKRELLWFPFYDFVWGGNVGSEKNLLPHVRARTGGAGRKVGKGQGYLKTPVVTAAHAMTSRK